MAEIQPIWIFDQNGPKLDATPSFVPSKGFINRAGVARALPAGLFSNRGGGQYTFRPTNDDELVGTCYLIDCGVGCTPRYQYGELHTAENQFVLAVPLDGNGDLGAGAFTIGSYEDLNNGSPRTPPAVVKAGAFEMYTVTPTLQDAALGVGLRLDAPAGMFPASLNAIFQGATVPAGVASFGGLEDLCDVIDLLASGVYTVTRRSPPAYSGGRRLPPLQAVFTTRGSVQPASGLEIKRLPGGKSNRETMVIFSCIELKTAELGQEPDQIAIDGGVFEVESVQRWAALGNYYRAIVTRRPGT